MTTITPALLAEIREKAEKAVQHRSAFGAAYWSVEIGPKTFTPYRLDLDPPTTLTLVAALEEAQRERDAAVKAHNECTEWLKESEAARGAALAEHDALRAENGRLWAALDRVVHDIDDLIGNSHGVCGLHKNGDEAPWSELTDGGQFEAWLSLDHARAALKETTHATDAPQS